MQNDESYIDDGDYVTGHVMDIIVIILSHGLFRISAGLRCDRDLFI